MALSHHNGFFNRSMNKRPLLFAGSSHLNLAIEICKELNIDLGKMDLSQFPDGETSVQILENVEGCDAFILQSIALDPNRYLFETLITIDALKRASAKSINAVIPYLGYCRQDKKDKFGAPITAKLIANLLTIAGITNLITFDLHTDQIEGFYDTHTNHLHCQQLLYDAYKRLHREDCVVIAPDIGSIKVAQRMAKLLNTELIVLKKERLNTSKVKMSLIGSLSNKNVLIVDDLCSTAETMVEAANLCHQKGARKIVGAVTHGLFVDNAIDKISSSPLDYFFSTNTIEHPHTLPQSFTTVSIAPLIIEMMKNYL